MTKTQALIGFLIFIGSCINAEAKLQHRQIRLGQRISIETTTIEFSKVKTDNRCPEGIDCIWPGIFVAEFKHFTSGSSKIVELGNVGGQPVVIGKSNIPNENNHQVGLSRIGQLVIGIDSVQPPRALGSEIREKDYILTLSIDR